MYNTVADFWRMIDETNVKAIVMLTNFEQLNQRGVYQVNYFIYKIRKQNHFLVFSRNNVILIGTITTTKLLAISLLKFF